jgi:hypothetical protein
LATRAARTAPDLPLARVHDQKGHEMMKGRLGRRLGLAALAAGLTGLVLGAASPAGATGGGGPVAQSILGSGSDTTMFMMQALDGLYLFSPGCQQLGSPQWYDFSCLDPDPPGTILTENYSHDQVHEAFYLGSQSGKNQLCQQGQSGVADIEFARSSSGPGQSDCTGLKFVAYARDGLSWEAWNVRKSGLGGNFSNQSGTCAGSGGDTKFCLTQTQIQGIWLTCTITSWSQVGGTGKAIALYTPQPGSGTRSTWDKFVGGDTSNCIADQDTHVIPENRNEPVYANGDYKRALVPFSYGVWTSQVHGKKGTILGAIDNVLPTDQTIADGSFPFGRFLYNVYCTACASGQQATANTIQYIGEEGWICKNNADHANDPTTGLNYRDEIETAIHSNGFVPIPEGVIGGGNTHVDHCRLFNH